MINSLLTSAADGAPGLQLYLDLTLLDHAAPPRGRPLEAENAVLLVIQTMIVHEEFPSLLLESSAEIIKSLHVRIAMVAVFNRDHAVIAFFLLLTRLFALRAF